MLIDQLRESGLLKPAQLDELARLPEAQESDPRALGRQVLQRGWLTRYQVNQVAGGRTKGLRIGPYLLLDLLGEGGMGQVFKAQHQHMSRVVALKVIRKDRLSHPKAVGRFYQEVQAAGQLHHPNIVLAFDAGEAGGTHFLSMEYVEGQDLHRLIREVGPLPVAQACDYIRQAALGLQHAHERRLVHRDIKPHNLLVTQAPAGDQTVDARGGAWGTVKVLDMGLARWRQGMGEEERALTRDGAVLGTADFMAPEQARHAHEVDARADLYSLGCTLYYLLTRRLPFHADSLAQLLLMHQTEDPVPLDSLRPDVPAGVLEIVRTLLAKRPEDRIQTAAELAAALEPFCGADSAARQPALTQAVGATREDGWATLLGEDEKPAPARARSVTDDRTAIVEEDEAPARGKKGRRRGGKGARDRASGNNPLVFALAGAGVVVAALLAAGAVIWLRSGPAKPPVAPPQTSAAVVEHGKGGGATTPTPPVPAAAGEPRRLEATPAPVDGLGFSPDGRLAVAADGQSACVWDVASGRLLKRLAGAPAFPVKAAAFTPDGRHVFLGGPTKVLQLWDVDEGRSLRDFVGCDSLIRAVAVSPDGRRVFAAAGQPEIRDGRPLFKDGRPVYRDCAVRAWDVTTGQELPRFEGHTDPVAQLTLSADGRRALSRSQQRVSLWETDGGREVRSLGDAAQVTAAALCPNGRHALLGTPAGLVLWDAEADREVRRFDGPAGRVTAVAVSADGGRAVSGSNVAGDGRVCLWDVATGRQLQSFGGHTDVIASVALTADGRLAASAGLDRTVRLWELGRPVAGP
jgi:serine/threonine-protein kinase